MTTLTREFTKGLWDEIPLFRIVLGLCPALAVTTSMENGVGMGLAATFVLVCSNGLIAALRNVIPDEVRVACYIVVIAAFVVCVEMITKAYFFTLSESLGPVHSAHRGELHHPGSRGGLRPQERRAGLARGRAGDGARVHPGAHDRRHHSRVLGAGTLGMIFGDRVLLAEPFSFLQQAPGAFLTLGLLLGG